MEGWKPNSSGTASVPIARTAPDAEECPDCGAIVAVSSRYRHREFHEHINAVVEAQERLNKATRQFVKLR